MDHHWKKPVGYTDVYSDCFSYLWKIEPASYLNCKKVDVSFKSPKIFDPCHKCYWSLELQSVTGHNRNWIKIIEYLQIVISHDLQNKQEIDVNASSTYTYELMFLDKKLCIVNSFVKSFDVNNETESTIRFNGVEGLLEATNNFDTLILHLNITDTNRQDVIDNIVKFDLREHQLETFNNLELLRKTKKFTDVTLIIGKEKLQAHKLILLASRSPVFSEIFDKDTCENQENIIEIKDFDKNVIEQMLYFIYTGGIKNVDEVSHDLLKFADKYAIEGLKKMCGQLLGSTLLVDNVIDFFLLADLYKCNELKNKIYRFIATNKKAVIESPAFEELSVSQPVLRNELLLKVYEINKCLKKPNSCSSFCSESFSFFWKLEHLSEDSINLKVDRIIKSPKFSDSLHKREWSLKLNMDSTVKLSLILENDCYKVINDSLAYYEFIIFDKNYTELFKEEGLDKFCGEKKSFTVDFIKEEKLFDKTNNFVCDGTLIIGCKVSKERENHVVDYIDSEFEKCKYKSDVCDKLELLRKNKTLTDVTLITGEDSIEAHKLILASRSPVFSAMFDNDMRESRENIVEIPDFDKNIVEEMLYFIYTGKIKNIDKVARDLLKCADMYAIVGLKEICEQFISSTLTTDNVFDVLLFADLYRCDALKNKTYYFISTHETVLETPEFGKLLKSHPDLANVALHEVLR